MSMRADPRTPRARRLRHEATPQERKLWARLRRVEWPGGGHFRRQVPIGPFYADFAHHGLKLVVELDGGQHSTDEAVRRDAARTAFLETAGYRVLRFWNAEVGDNFDGVIDTIYAAAVEVPPTPVRARNKSGRDSALPAASGGRVGAWGGLVPFLIALFCSLAPMAPAHAYEQRQIGAWVLKWATARIGAYCTVEAVQDGRTLGFQIVRDGMTFFGLRNPDWRWEPKSSHEARLTVDGKGWSGKAISPLPDTLVMPIRPDRDVDPSRVMEGGRSLAFETEGSTITFDLTGFREAADAQRACLAESGPAGGTGAKP